MTNLPKRKEALALLKKYRAGKCTPEEINRVDSWYNALGDNIDISSRDEAAINDATKRMLFLTKPERIEPKAKKLEIKTWVGIAASLLIGITMLAIFLRQDNTPPQKSNETYATANGQRKEIRLPDGSTIDLNVASSLKLINFNKNNRLVSLTGEAFFHIAKDKRHPFIIRTGKIQTRVLGTSFNIFAYSNEPVIRVAVATGKVQVEDSNSPKRVFGKNMTKDNLFAYSKIDGTYSLTTADVNKSDAWLYDRLNFNKATIGEIGRTLQRNFNVPVSITGQHIEDAHFTVKFDKTNIDEILNQLSMLTGVACNRTKQRILINTDTLNKP